TECSSRASAAGRRSGRSPAIGPGRGPAIVPGRSTARRPRRGTVRAAGDLDLELARDDLDEGIDSGPLIIDLAGLFGSVRDAGGTAHVEQRRWHVRSEDAGIV